ncbi:MAG TPA: hypothetical protein VD994_06425, partial [Prosthecobacter sp.]|nr:hypothetical protein [Prosthecobacter sp.]
MPAASRLISRYSYKVDRLDAGEELEKLSQRLTELEKRPSVKTAKGICAASQRVLYALDELKYLVGSTDASYRSRLQSAKDLL